MSGSGIWMEKNCADAGVCCGGTQRILDAKGDQQGKEQHSSGRRKVLVGFLLRLVLMVYMRSKRDERSFFERGDHRRGRELETAAAREINPEAGAGARVKVTMPILLFAKVTSPYLMNLTHQCIQLCEGVKRTIIEL